MRPSRWPSVFAALVVLTDLALINGSFVATSLFRFSSPYPTGGFTPYYVRYQVFVNLALPLCLVFAGAYRDLRRAPLGHQAVTSFKACVWNAAIVLAMLIVARDEPYSRAFIAFHLAQLAVLIPFSRILLVRLNEVAHLRGVGVRRVLVAGEREPLRDLALFLRMSPHLGYRVEAVLPVGFEDLEADPQGPRILAGREDLRRALAEGGIERVFICDPNVERARWKTVLDLADEHRIEARAVRWPLVVPDFRARIHDILTVPVVPGKVPGHVAEGAKGGIRVQCRGWRAAAKRAVDVVGSSALLLACAPFLALTALAIKLDSPGPVFYRQRRLTRGGRAFDILKFRSMGTLADEDRARLADANEASGPIFKIRNDPRVTRVGSLLRRFSLDELPQLFNVLKGDLSLVGPRPPIPEEAEQYEPWQRQRLDVVQGMTGLWQVSGRSRLGFDQMALLDLYYIENWSLLLDIEILMETLPTVLHGDGAF